MKDLDGKYYFEESVDGAVFNMTDKSYTAKDKNIEGSTWSVCIISLADNHDFLTISDETGEPLYYQNLILWFLMWKKIKEDIS